MKKFTLMALLATVLFVQMGWPQARDTAEKPALQSVYTNLGHGTCRLRKVDAEGGDSSQVCAGTGGYKLLLLDSDSRMSVTVMSPGAQNYPLKFSEVVTPHFSEMGKAAEWRVRKQGRSAEPVALIVPLSIIEDPDTGATALYWIVAKITKDSACVIGKFKAGAGVKEQVRQTADSASGQPCLTP